MKSDKTVQAFRAAAASPGSPVISRISARRFHVREVLFQTQGEPHKILEPISFGQFHAGWVKRFVSEQGVVRFL